MHAAGTPDGDVFADGEALFAEAEADLVVAVTLFVVEVPLAARLAAEPADAVIPAGLEPADAASCLVPLPFRRVQAAIGVDAQKAACKTIEEILLADTPVLVPYFYDYISGYSNKFTGVRVSALGQMFLDQASMV